MLRIGSIAGMNGMDQYRISSIHGNPNSLRPVNRLQLQESADGNAPLVIARKDTVSPYIKDYGELPKTTHTTVGDFHEYFKTEGDKAQDSISKTDNLESSYLSFLQDTMGVMGTNYYLKYKLETHL